MDLATLQKAINVASNDMLDDIFDSLLATMWLPSNLYDDFDQQCKLLDEKSYWYYELEFTAPTWGTTESKTFEVFLDVFTHEAKKPVRKYHLSYIPKWLKPLAQRAKWDEEKQSFKVSCNTYYENLDGSLND